MREPKPKIHLVGILSAAAVLFTGSDGADVACEGPLSLPAAVRNTTGSPSTPFATAVVLHAEFAPVSSLWDMGNAYREEPGLQDCNLLVCKAPATSVALAGSALSDAYASTAGFQVRFAAWHRGSAWIRPKRPQTTVMASVRRPRPWR